MLKCGTASCLDLLLKGTDSHGFRLHPSGLAYANNRHRRSAPVPIYICISNVNMSPVPTYLRAGLPHGSNPDASLMASAEVIPAASFRSPTKARRFIPAVPLGFIQQTLVVGDALPLVLVLLMEMRVRGAVEVAVGPAIWAAVGNPSKRVRARLLRQVSQLPPDVCTLTPRNGRPHLLRVGPNWPKPTTATGGNGYSVLNTGGISIDTAVHELALPKK